MNTHLFLRLSALGDLVLCSALVAEVAARDPGARLIFATDARLAPLLTSFPARVEVLALSRPRLGLLGWIWLGYKNGRSLRLPDSRTELRTVFDLHGVGKTLAFRAGLALALAGVPRTWQVLSTRKYGFRRWLSIVLRRDLLGARFVYREHLALAGRAQFPAATRPTLVSEKTPQLLTPPGSPTRVPRSVLAAPDASHWKKRWPADSWRLLLGKLLSDGHSVTLVGGARALPQDVIDDLEALGGERWQNLLGRTEVTELPAIAARHAVTVCSNSAWLHISEAVGTPVVALAGPIIPGFGFSPWQRVSEELSVQLKCRPCSKHGDGLCYRTGDDFHACMRNLTPDQVSLALERVLGAQRGRQ